MISSFFPHKFHRFAIKNGCAISAMGLRDMPLDLILVRHGASEGNIAFNESKKGNDAFITKEFIQTHESKWRLTKIGREQAIKTGEWIKGNIGEVFGAYLSSEYVRALETAALLDLPNANWERDPFLRERNFGRMSVLTHTEREERFKAEMEARKRDSFYWTPPSGESLADVSIRVDLVLDSLAQRDLHPSSTIIVSHFNVMQVIRTRIEAIRQVEFEDKLINVPEELKIKNAAVIHYTRIDPETKEIAPTYRWMRIAVPWLGGKQANPPWMEITYRYVTNQDIISHVPYD